MTRFNYIYIKYLFSKFALQLSYSSRKFLLVCVEYEFESLISTEEIIFTNTVFLVI